MSLPLPIDNQPAKVVIPFASGDNAVADAVPAAGAVGSEPKPNLADGFPLAFSSHGNYVTRGQMNGVWKIPTTNECRRQLGGINTYNPKLVEMLKGGAATGGYAKDAILDWWDERNQILHSVISLKDDNDYDFTQKGDDGYSRGPDGENWALCSGGGTWLPDYSAGESAYSGSLNLPTAIGYVTPSFEMPFNGFVSCNFDCEYTVPCQLFAALEASSVSLSFNSWSMVGSMLFYTVNKTGHSDMYGFVSGSIYDNCRHSIYLALSETDEFSVDMSNVIDGDFDDTVIHVSSSGTEGGGGCALIPVRKGMKMRLLGYQTYSEAKTDMSHADPGPWTSRFSEQVFSNNSLSKVGKITVAAYVTAYPAIGRTFD